jgi:5-methyltetrahydropteroyltriglutamate--homocysteine methyltransferase
MFTATADTILPSTVTGSFPQPRWFDASMLGRPLDTCMLDVRFREKFQDALVVEQPPPARSAARVALLADVL